MTRDQSSTFLYRWRAELLDADLPFAAKAVALMLSMYATSATGADARPGLDRLARHAGLDPSNVRRHLRAAQDAGWIKKTGGGHNGRAVTYALTLPVGGQHRTPTDGTKARGDAHLPNVKAGAPAHLQDVKVRADASVGAQEGAQDTPLKVRASTTPPRDLVTSSTSEAPTMPTVDEPQPHDDNPTNDERSALWRLLAGTDPDDANQVIDELDRRDLGNPRGYLATIIRNGDLDQLIAEARRATITIATNPGRRFYSTEPDALRTCGDCGTTIAMSFTSPTWLALDATPCTHGEDSHTPARANA